MTEELFSAKQPDNFSTESPIRAFTEWDMSGTVAIGKGFRPSMGHLVRYLHAMEEKEGWRLVQILLGSGAPTMIFHREVANPIMPELLRIAAPAPVEDDPVNPKHYGGTPCAEIGELLTANSYQVLKYNWRLGKKDDACIEIGKSIWYLDREIALISEGYRPEMNLPDRTFFEHRLHGQDDHVKLVAGLLVMWCRHGNDDCLHQLRAKLEEKKVHLDCGRGLAI